MMSRSQIIELLHSYEPYPGEDPEVKFHAIKFAESSANCFERSNLTGHFTGSAWVVDESGEKVLLTHHRKLGEWLQLGGHADGNPDLLAVAMQEAHEESGLEKIVPVSEKIFDIDIHLIPAWRDVPEHLHYDVRFVLQASSLTPLIVTQESNDLAWVALDELDRYNPSESIRRMRRKWAVTPSDFL